MSTNPDADELTADDRAFLDHLEGETESRPPEEQIAELRRENRELEEEVQDLRDELTATKKTLFAQLNELQDKVNGQDPTDPRANNFYEHLTILEKYSRMSEAEREDLLDGSPSKQRAVLIFQNWTDWARNVDAGWLINTNHTRGKHGKSGIKIDLEQATGEDLQANEVYRAMRMVAKLSAQEREDVDVVTDQYGRKHITGGAFEYHEKVNPDATGQSRKFKVLKLTDEDAVTLP